jgi:hypothetical protein
MGAGQKKYFIILEILHITDSQYFLCVSGDLQEIFIMVKTRNRTSDFIY